MAAPGSGVDVLVGVAKSTSLLDCTVEERTVKNMAFIHFQRRDVPFDDRRCPREMDRGSFWEAHRLPLPRVKTEFVEYVAAE